MARKKNMVREAEKYAQYLIWEATGGAMGREPPRPKNVKEEEFKIDFNTKRALLDSMIKLIGMKSKVDPVEEDEDGIETYKSMLNGSGETDSRGTADPSAGSSPVASAIRPGTNGHAADFLE